MSSLFEEIQRDRAARDQSLDGLFAGTIAETAALVTAFDPTLQFGPCMWMPRLEPYVINVAQGAESTDDFTVARLVLPARGNRCLVGFDDLQVPWILVWWPS